MVATYQPDRMLEELDSQSFAGAVNRSAASRETAPGLSLIIPTRNEAPNIEPLLEHIAAATRGEVIEVIIVDDSDDDTVQAVEAAGENQPFAVRLIARPPERRNGLGLAVVEGMHAARYPWICVMDGDLQHPPEMILRLLEKARVSRLDLVAGSRLAEGSQMSGLSQRRQLVSRALAAMSRRLFPRQLATVSDPLTGFFVVRRAAVDPHHLRPEGFKILLEILVKHPQLRVSELPFTFGHRHAGTSKAGAGQVMQLFQQILRLMFGPREHLFRFLTVGFSGLIVNTLLIALFTEWLGLHYLLSAILATEGSTLWNFAGTEAWVFGDRKQPGSIWSRLASFAAINNGLLVVRGPALGLLVSGLGMNYVVANLLTLVLMTAGRFAMADRVIWRRGRAAGGHGRPYHYNIHGILRVRSPRRLPELAYFLTTPFTEPADIEVRIDHNPTATANPNTITFAELPGRFGFALAIERQEERTEVRVSPLVARSPHVLYTNVVEPLLRWQLVRRGYALMHGATVAFRGQAIFITARTDTGKTTTILHTLRQNLSHGGFLSDDMTIFDASGQLLSYPKPLTISQHTLRAIGGARLRLGERLFLQVQSRLHSRGGRRAAMMLNTSRIPAATLNAIVQMIIPPPKYMIDRLVSGVSFIDTARLAHVVLIERGPTHEDVIPDEDRLGMLIGNAEDAYGFPPYPLLARRLSTWDGQDLQAAEQAIVAAALDGVPGIRLRSSQYDWYRRLPLLARDEGETQDMTAPDLIPVPSPLM